MTMICVCLNLFVCFSSRNLPFCLLIHLFFQKVSSWVSCTGEFLRGKVNRGKWHPKLEMQQSTCATRSMDHLIVDVFVCMVLHGFTLQETNISHFWKKENHLQTCNFKGYVSSKDGNMTVLFFFFRRLGWWFVPIDGPKLRYLTNCYKGSF